MGQVSKGAMETLRRGSKGRNVKELQLRLNKETLFDGKGQKLPKLVSDGDYGGHTEDAVKAYQRAHNLKLDGIAGPNTLESLGFTCNEHILTPKADGEGLKQVYLKKKYKYEAEAGNKIKDNAQNIIDAANCFGVDPRVVAGVIYAEQSINVDFKDTLTDWTGFYGVNTSVGLGQVRISTAEFLEEKGYITKTKASEGGWNLPFIGHVDGTTTMAREKRLENDRINCYYVAAYIRYFQDTWKYKFPSIAGRPDILGTLFNIGHEVTKPNSNPKPNEFGQYVKDNYDTMGYLLGL